MTDARMNRFAPFSDFELKEIWYAVTRDECGWPMTFAQQDPLYPFVKEMYDEAMKRGLADSEDEYGRRDYWDTPVGLAPTP